MCLALDLPLAPRPRLAAFSQFAQRGGIQGNVSDQTGVILPGVEVTLLDLTQKQTRSVKSDSSGHFEFDNLTAGQYQVSASIQGFQTAQSAAIAVDIGGVSTYNFKLQPGSVSETVNVSAETAGMQTDQVGVNTNISTRQMEDLPLNGRNFTAIMALAPGVSTYPQSNINPGGTYSVGAQFALAARKRPLAGFSGLAGQWFLHQRRQH